jgi:tetrahydromethanopterin S-methyltransferase subunit G
MDNDERKKRDSHYFIGIARLRDGVSIATADAEIKTIGKRLTRLFPDTNTHKEFLVRSLQEEITRGIGQQVWLLFGAVALVLLVACGRANSACAQRSVPRAPT